MPTDAIKNKVAVFGGGCFWCTEAVFKELNGVESVESGYAGGTVVNPTYEQVCGGATGHAEVVKVGYDPAKISYQDLLTVFFATHDPTTINRQGADVGSQYRSIVLYSDAEQERAAEEFVLGLNDNITPNIVTEVKPLEQFYPAEERHREFYLKNRDAPYCQLVINPKIDKLKDKFQTLLKK